VPEDTPDVITAPNGETSPEVAPSSGAPEVTSPTQGTPQAGEQQSLETKEQPAESDPLEGVPPLEQLKAEADQKVKYANDLVRLRTAYEDIAPKYKDLASKYEPIAPVIDRFGSPEEVTNWIEARDELFKQNRTNEGYLVPDPSPFAERITKEAPVTADYLTSKLIWGTTVDQATGQQVQRIVPLLQNIAEEPTLRAQALEILGAVEPSQIPQPAWTATQEELDKIASLGLDEKKTTELQEAYKRLPYEEREEIRMNSPEFIKKHIETQQFLAQSKAKEEREQAEATANAERERQAFQQATHTAGAQYIDQSIKEGLGQLTEGIVKDWQPTDDPVMNKFAASLVGVVTTALAHGETRFAGEMLLGAMKEMGIPVDLTPFDTALNSYIDQARNFGELNFVAQRRKSANGNGNGDLSYYKAQADRSRQSLTALSRNAIASKLQSALDKFFVTRATAHNETLESAVKARPTVSGAPVTAGAGNPLIGKPANEHPWSR
jgi:hypothetical protein